MEGKAFHFTKDPCQKCFEIMKGTFSLKINPSPIPSIVKNKSYKGYLQELKIGEVSNSLRQLALKIQSYELPARLRCSPLGLCVSKLKLILLSHKSFTTSALNKQTQQRSFNWNYRQISCRSIIVCSLRTQVVYIIESYKSFESLSRG